MTVEQFLQGNPGKAIIIREGCRKFGTTKFAAFIVNDSALLTSYAHGFRDNASDAIAEAIRIFYGGETPALKQTPAEKESAA